MKINDFVQRMMKLLPEKEQGSYMSRMYTELNLGICCGCAHYRAFRDREPCKSCEIEPSGFEEKDKS